MRVHPYMRLTTVEVRALLDELDAAQQEADILLIELNRAKAEAS